jgi:hypothetical protein
LLLPTFLLSFLITSLGQDLVLIRDSKMLPMETQSKTKEYCFEIIWNLSGRLEQCIVTYFLRMIFRTKIQRSTIKIFDYLLGVVNNFIIIIKLMSSKQSKITATENSGKINLSYPFC